MVSDRTSFFVKLSAAAGLQFVVCSWLAGLQFVAFGTGSFSSSDVRSIIVGFFDGKAVVFLTSLWSVGIGVSCRCTCI